MMNGVTAVGMFGGTNGSSNVFENMISLEESSLLPDELYTVELKAMMTRRLANGSPDNGLIRIGFTSNPEQRTDVSDVEWVADFNVIESNKRESDIRNNCNLMKSDFQELNQTFEYKSSYGRYIVIFVDGDEGDAIRNYIIESLNFTQCCELDPSMSISGDCDNLSLVGENDGYGGTYTWTTGDGTTYRGSGPHQHNFLHPGDYEICMILSCDITHEQIELCEEYTVENMDGPCNSCMPGPPSIAIACQDDDGFDAEICFDLPEGTSSCTDDRSPHIFSDNGTVELNNWEPLDGSPILDQYCVSIHLSDITTPKKTVYFHACDAEGNRMCFSSVITPLQCTNCEETSIQSVAQCNRQMSTGTTNLYEGAVTIDLEPGQFICPESNVTTTTAGFSGNIIINTHNTVTIEYSITTNGIPSIPIEAILNICDDEAKPYCYRFTIIPEICPVIPEECIERWEPKQWECSLLSNGESVIEYEMFFKDIDYNVCPGGLVTAISGDASVEVVNVTSPQTGGNNNLLVQLNISIPCPDVQNAPYDLQLFLCNEEGGTVCFNIPIIPVNCCDEGESNGDTFNKAISRGDSSLGSEDFHFFPNPTQNDLTIIVSPTIIENVEKDIRINIIDQTGKLMINKSIRSTSEVLDITTLTNGIYLVHISTPDGVSAVKKLVVIK